MKINQGDSEFRTKLHYTDPFPLHPGELLVKISDIETIPRDCYGKIVAMREFMDGEIRRFAGDEWLIEGPITYIPRIEERLDVIVKPIIIGKNQAAKLRARRTCIDVDGIERKDKEEWLIRTPGFYTPRIDEEVVSQHNIDALTITET